jgi:4-amino-4-deoxy-L-arabinose transferase-like glycosyltransferase
VKSHTRDGSEPGGARVQGLARPLVAVTAAGAVLAVVLVFTLALQFIWLARFRHGYLTEWDESGYLQFALSDFDALHDHGLVSFLETVGGRGTFGPLLPAVTAIAYPVVGRGVFGSLLVLPFFFAGLVLATFGVARQVVSDAWAVVAALAVAAIPGITDYTRLYHFAVPAAACTIAALWALLRSNALLRTRWAIAFGFFVGLALLARTMTVAYLPGLALAPAAQLVIVRHDLRLRARNLAVAAATSVLVAGPWYVRNARSVYDYLVHRGYGEGGSADRAHHPFLSWSYWTQELRADLYYLWLPFGAVIALCFLAVFAAAVIRLRRGEAVRPSNARLGPLAALALVVVEGYLALTSAQDSGTAFPLPWLPALVVLAVAAAAAVPVRAARLALGSALVVVSIGAILSKSGLVAPLATVRTVSLPSLGSTPVTDGTGVIQRVVADAGYDIGPITHPLPDVHRRWLPVEREVVGWLLARERARGQSLNLTLGLDDPLFTWSRLTLAAQLRFHRYLSVDYLRSTTGGDTVASYRRQLVVPWRENALITGEPSRAPIMTITRGRVEAAARSLGFLRVKSYTLPDGRMIWIWFRDQHIA